MTEHQQNTYSIVPNHFGLSAHTIAAIYKDRWQIELFFKTIKQNLKTKYFLGAVSSAITTDRISAHPFN